MPFKKSIRSVRSASETPQSLAAELTTRPKEIVGILKQGPHSILQVIDKMGTRLTERTVQRELAALKKMRLVRSSGRARATLWDLLN